MRVPLECPICGSKISYTEDSVHSIMEASYKIVNNGEYIWVPDYYVKCWKCGKEIAIKKVG